MLPIYDANPTKVFPFVTISIVLVTSFVWVFIQGSGHIDALDYSICKFASSQNYHLDYGVSHNSLCLVDNVGSISLITSIFIHDEWLHILMNLWFLWLFGNNIEEAFGRFKFLIFYLSAGVLTELISIIFSDGSVILSYGASGSVAAVLGAYAVIFRHAKILIFMPLTFKFLNFKSKSEQDQLDKSPWLFYLHANYFILMYVGFDLWSLFDEFMGGISGVNIVAHLSGYLIGGLVAYVALKRNNLDHIKEVIENQEKTRKQSGEINPIVLKIVNSLQLFMSWAFILGSVALLVFILIEIRQI